MEVFVHFDEISEYSDAKLKEQYGEPTLYIGEKEELTDYEAMKNAAKVELHYSVVESGEYKWAEEDKEQNTKDTVIFGTLFLAMATVSGAYVSPKVKKVNRDLKDKYPIQKVSGLKKRLKSEKRNL